MFRQRWGEMEKFWANWTIIPKIKACCGYSLILNHQLGVTNRRELVATICPNEHQLLPWSLPPQKKHTWVSLTSVSPVVCLPGVHRSFDGFFVHAFTSGSFPRKASNISLDFYFLDLIVNNKSQVTNWTARHKAVALKLIQQAAVSSTKITQAQRNTEN